MLTIISKVNLYSISKLNGSCLATLKSVVIVVIAVSSQHRKASFAACEFLIDELKKTVPIWKKEFMTNGAYWVNSRP